MLQRVMNIPDEQLDEVMLCGGFGNYIHIASAVDISLLPALPLERITYFGNAAALGAQMALLSETERARASVLARRIEHVALATNPDFQEIFIEAVQFPGSKSMPANRGMRRPAARARRAATGL